MKKVTDNDIMDLQRLRSKQSRKGAMLCMILKSGKPGKPRFYENYGDESTQDIINRLEKLNPGFKWITAE